MHSGGQNIKKGRLLWSHSLVHGFGEFRSGFRGFGAWLLGPMNMVSGKYECREEAVGFKTDRKQRTSKGLRIRYDFQCSYVEDFDPLGVDVCAG